MARITQIFYHGLCRFGWYRYEFGEARFHFERYTRQFVTSVIVPVDWSFIGSNRYDNEHSGPKKY